MFTTFIGGSTNPPVRVGTDVDYSSTTAANSFTFAVTLNAAANKLVVCVTWGRNNNPGTVTATYNAVSMTRSKADSDSVSSLYAGVAIFTLDSPAVGSAHDVVVSFASSNVDDFCARATGLSGAGAVLTTVSATGGGSNASALTGDLVTIAPSFILGAMAVSRTSGTPTYTPGTGVTELADTAVGTLGAFIGERQESAAGTFAFAATCSQSHTAVLAAVAIGSV